ncbi:unnamed protein product [Mesocestoides corti]|uniref:Cap-specific mRNA (nucleoside-2'-O-)-methyltransferase 1 n=1 Tax=Mesocestoides corti TaxID=53468 RepID=A0A0R3UK35_MESCO|nr:unnamed protein product [Mesocestoides corti]
MAKNDDNRELLVVAIDLTPVWWGTYAHENLILPTFIESILAFVNVHLMLSPLNEVAIIGVTPERTEFLWPSPTPIEEFELQPSQYGQYEALTVLGETVRRKVNKLVSSCESLNCTVTFSGAVIKALCYFMRRCRELRPTVALPTNSESTTVGDDLGSLLRDNFHARILVVRAAEDTAAQYLALMNAVFTAQKLRVPIDACIIPPTTMSHNTDDPLRQSSTTLQEASHSSLFQQAADLTGGIYLRVPRPAGLLQYLISVFLPRSGLRSQLILPDSRSASTGVDFRAACFCHRKLVDLAYLQGPEMHSKAWHIMSGMGYEAGKGLGAMSQGRTEPVTVQTKHDRRGVGGGAGSHLRDSTTGDFPRGPHAWTEETEEVKVDGDLVYEWSRWTGEKDVDDLPHLALEGIQGGILPPTSPDALGPPVCDLGTQTRYCSSELLQEVLQYKNCLDNMPRDLLTSARIRSNPFEEIRKGIFMNRAAMKMANMDSLTNGLFSQAAPPHFSRSPLGALKSEVVSVVDAVSVTQDRFPAFNQELTVRDARSPPYCVLTFDEVALFLQTPASSLVPIVAFEGSRFFSTLQEILHFADICAGPGGFSEYLTWRRGASALAAAESTTGNSAAALFPRVRGYGMTLSGSCDFRLDNFLAGPAEVFRPFYGPKQDGDITSWANLEGFANLIHKNTDGRGVHVVMADGGFDASSGYNLQEVQSKHIYLCQCLCALTLLRPSGSFVTKLFDVVTDFSVDLIWLMSHVFKKVSLIKPVTSRPANSERYLLCEGLITSSSGMAGCPRAPSKASSSDGRAEPAVNEGEFKRRPRGLKVDYSCGYCYPSTPAHTHGTESGQFDSTSAVGTLIQHFLAVSEELHARSTGESTASNQECLDVLRLASDAALCNDTGFKTFITNANDKIAENQCIYLTKLLTYAQDATLEDTNQKSIRDACLAKWKVPSVERHSVPWPLWPSNIHKVLDSIIGNPGHRICAFQNFPRTFSPELLPDDLKRPSKVPAFSPADLYRRDFNQLSMLALVLAAPHLNGSNELPRPMMVLSCGVSSQFERTHLNGSRAAATNDDPVVRRLVTGTHRASTGDWLKCDIRAVFVTLLQFERTHLNGSRAAATNDDPVVRCLAAGTHRPSTGGWLTSCRLKYTYDGSQWDEFSNSLLHFNPRLPAASLVWALPVNTYCQCGLRRSALVVLDAAFLYGVDLRSLHYQQRMRHVRKLCEVANFVGESRAKLIAPPLIPLAELSSYMKQLPVRSCRDQPVPAPMLTTDFGSSCIPESLILVHHLGGPWIVCRSRSTNCFYYFNVNTQESTYELPPDAALSFRWATANHPFYLDPAPIFCFRETRFFSVDWKGNSRDDFDAAKLAAIFGHIPTAVQLGISGVSAMHARTHLRVLLVCDWSATWIPSDCAKAPSASPPPIPSDRLLRGWQRQRQRLPRSLPHPN